MAQTKQSTPQAVVSDPAVAAFQLSFAGVVFLAAVVGLLLLGMLLQYLRTPVLESAQPATDQLQLGSSQASLAQPQSTITGSRLQGGVTVSEIQGTVSIDEIQPAAPVR